MAVHITNMLTRFIPVLSPPIARIRFSIFRRILEIALVPFEELPRFCNGLLVTIICEYKRAFDYLICAS